MALFALAVQIVLSFSHIDLCGFGATAANASQSAVADGSAGRAPGAPVPAHKSDGSANPGCAICALIQLAATAAPSSPPALPLPATLRLVRFDAPAELPSATLPHLSFQARAPPSI